MLRNLVIRSITRRSDGSYRLTPYGSWGKVYILSVEDLNRYAQWESRAIIISSLVFGLALLASEALAIDPLAKTPLFLPALAYVLLRHWWIGRAFRDRNVASSPRESAENCIEGEGALRSFIESASFGPLAITVPVAALSIILLGLFIFAASLYVVRHGDYPPLNLVIASIIFLVGAYVSLRALFCRYRRYRGKKLNSGDTIHN